ncbi:MAG: electron transport complex subunit RsxC [Deltaproteobacteria bacterium]|nr:electron transport complex subunit RsxC [Deltaproteobacteria bacterium]
MKTFKRGIHPAYHKELTSGSPIEDAVLPKRVVVPLQQHAGTPCAPLVKKGDEVREGQKIGDADSFVSAPVHAPITGRVKDVAPHIHPAGARVLSVIIEGDGASKEEWKEDPSAPDAERLSAEEIRKVIREAGIVGLGGAAFPTAVKLSPPKDRKIDTVILNGCECEPYLTADHRVMIEEPEKVVQGLKIIMRAVGASAGCIGIEDNKTDCADSLSRAIAKDPRIGVILLETKYPQGAEKMLIKAVLRRNVPLGKLPLDVGVIVNNVATAVKIFEAVRYKKPLIDRVVTVSGNGVKTPKNLRVRIGTAFSDVLGQCGGLSEEGEREILAGGPMMGVAQKNLDVPVVKGTSGITVVAGASVKPIKYEPCIRCSNCVEVCPMGLMPYRIADMGKMGMMDGFKSWSALACIECGCCSFVCPAQRPLVEWIRVGKIRLRNSEKTGSM